MNIEKLIRKSVEGNLRAQKLLYEKYIDFLFSIVLRYIGNEADAEDVLLQSFQKIFLNLEEFNYLNEKAFVGWMKKIVINEALMFIRKEFSTIYKLEQLDDVKETVFVMPELVDENELIELIEQLPKGYKTVFLLHVVDGYSHKEIALNLKIRESTSRSQFFKARNLLQKKLANYYGTAIGS